MIFYIFHEEFNQFVLRAASQRLAEPLRDINLFWQETEDS